MFTKLNKRMRKLAVVGLLGGATLLQAVGTSGCEYVSDSFWNGFEYGYSLSSGEGGYVQHMHQPAQRDLSGEECPDQTLA